MSPGLRNSTVSAAGASTRNVTRRSAPTSGERTAGAARAPQNAPPAPEYSRLIATSCITCHNDRLKTGGLSLQSVDLANAPAHADVWEKVLRKLRTGEMPPATVRVRPDARTVGALQAYLEASLDAAAGGHPDPGRAP